MIKSYLTQLQKINDRQYYFLLLIIFLIVSAIGILNHEMWRDELEAWLIARDSVSVTELLENLKYTGHPSLWYLCLHLLSKITANPLIVQLFHLTIAGGVIFVFLYYSTFNKLQKALFCFGYFPLYEYGVISRSYSFGVLFIFIFCALFCRKKHNYICLAIVLALLSHTSIYGLIIGIIFAVMLVSTAITKIHASKTPISRQRDLVAKLAISAAIYSIALTASIIQIIPPNAQYDYNISSLIGKENSIDVAKTSNDSLESLRAIEPVITGIWRSYVPIPNFARSDFWRTNILAGNEGLPEIATVDSGSLAAAFLSLILFLTFVFIFIRNHKVLFIYIFGTVAIALFGLFVRVPALRHSGHYFILLIACLWIYIYELHFDLNSSESKKYYVDRLVRRYQRIVLTIILCIQFYAGVRTFAIDLVKPFSSSKNVARFIKNNNLAETTIVGSKNTLVFPMSAWLDRQIYYPEIQEFGTFTVWTSKIAKYDAEVTQQDILRQIEQLKIQDSDSLLLILNDKLRQTSTSLDINFLASYENSIVGEERYFVYYVN